MLLHLTSTITKNIKNSLYVLSQLIFDYFYSSIYFLFNPNIGQKTPKLEQCPSCFHSAVVNIDHLQEHMVSTVMIRQQSWSITVRIFIVSYEYSTNKLLHMLTFSVLYCSVMVWAKASIEELALTSFTDGPHTSVTIPSAALDRSLNSFLILLFSS